MFRGVYVMRNEFEKDFFKGGEMKNRNANLIWNNRFAVSLTVGVAIFLFIDVIYNIIFAGFLAYMLLGMILMVVIMRPTEERRNDR